MSYKNWGIRSFERSQSKDMMDVFCYWKLVRIISKPIEKDCEWGLDFYESMFPLSSA